MTRASRRYLRPEAVQRIHRLELRAHAVVEGVLAGLHKSPYKGQSVEFLQHREYVRGDDLRRVDWKVWGRQDRLYLKEFEEETNLRLTLLVDATKVIALAASLAWLALSHGDAVGCGVFDDRLRASVPTRMKRSQLTGVCEVLEAARPGVAGDFLRVLRTAAETLPKRGMVIVISDLLGDRDGIFAGLQLLRARGHDLALLHVMDDDELDFPFEGPTRFEGLELPAHLACNPRALRAGYLEAVEGFLAEVRSRAAAMRCDHALVRTGEAVDAALVRFLSRRASLAV